MKNVTILVEGYHDRAFVSGWLEHRGWNDPGKRTGSRRRPVVNPVTNKTVGSGRYGFASRDDKSSFVEIAPSHGDTTLLSALEVLVPIAAPPSPDMIVVVLDPDGFDLAAGRTRRRQSVEGHLKRGALGLTSDDDGWVLASGTKVRLALWSCENSGQGIPDTHTLERSVCAALAQAYPERAHSVQQWLDSRPDPPVKSAKEYAWSYMAGWFADRGCDAFLSKLWNDPKVAAALSTLLRASDVSRVIEALECGARPAVARHR